MSCSDDLLNPAARAIFALAIKRDRCGELLNHLFKGGGVTLDQSGDDFILIPVEVLAELGDES